MAHGVRVIFIAMILVWCGAAAFSNQDPAALNPTARARIEQARASIVRVKAVDQSNKTVSAALGFFIRKDLVATDSEILGGNLRLEPNDAATHPIKVSSSGNYSLPYVLVEPQAEVSPLSLADSAQVATNDSVYMLTETGKIVAGRVTGTTTIKNTQAFLINLPIDSENKGAPIFNRYGEVIGIAAKSPDGQTSGLAWPSELLATLKHLGEPGVGVGAGQGRPFSVEPRATNSEPAAASSVDTKPVRLSSPPPRYTEAARANNTQGTVTLRVLIAADGSVQAIRVVRGLPDGLTDQAIAVARLTKFKPAMKDGKPVPYWIGLDVSFNLR
jgi:TonB family protein